MVLNSTTSVNEAAAKLVQYGAEMAPVLRDGEFIGVVTALDLLKELSRVWDPLTDLPWMERLREWSVDQFERGDEITLLYIDVDDFELYNRRYGHIQGDLLLRGLAEQFASAIDPSFDVLARLGGDEFVIGTIRPLENAQEMVAQLRTSIGD